MRFRPTLVNCSLDCWNTIAITRGGDHLYTHERADPMSPAHLADPGAAIFATVPLRLSPAICQDARRSSEGRLKERVRFARTRPDLVFGRRVRGGEKERSSVSRAFESMGGEAVSGFERWVGILGQHAEGARRIEIRVSLP